MNTDEFVAISVQSGTWMVEGYLLSVTPSDRRGWIGTIGRWGSLLLINRTVYSRLESPRPKPSLQQGDSIAQT